MKRSKQMVRQVLDEADVWTLSMIAFVAVAMLIIGLLRSSEMGSGAVEPVTETGFNTLENPEAGPVLTANFPGPDAGTVASDSGTSDQ